MRFSVYQESKKGGRKVNQDRMGYLYTRDSLLMLVADGMGGHARGEVASQLTLQTMAAIYQRDAKPLLTDPVRYLEEAVLAAHRELHRYRAEHSLPEAPRTTLVACIVQQGMAIWAHVGDSRLYHFRAGQVLRRTLDHTVTEQMHLDGVISEEEMKHHPEKSRLLKALGGSRPPTISLGEETVLMPGDTLLLCTDGLWEALSAEQLAGHLKAPSLEEAVEEMLFAAELRMRQNADNLSAISLRWEDAPTTALPLQSHGVPEANPQTLLTDTEALLAGRKRKAEAKPPDPKKSLDATIDELEAFLAKFEKQ